LAELERLHRKYGPDLIDHLAKVRREMDSIGLTENKKDELESQLARTRQAYDSAAEALSTKRRSATRKLEKLVEAELKSLAMPHARFSVQWEDVRPGRVSGTDRP